MTGDFNLFTCVYGGSLGISTTEGVAYDALEPPLNRIVHDPLSLDEQRFLFRANDHGDFGGHKHLRSVTRVVRHPAVLHFVECQLNKVYGDFSRQKIGL